MNIEEYIKENREVFNEGTLPQGHHKRFLEKLQAQENKHAKKQRTFTLLTRTLLSAAAVFLLAFIIGELSGNKKEKDYLALMLQEEEEVIQLISQADPFTGELMLNALENITFEAIPLKEQLPQEISDTQRKEILQAYYKQKTEGIQEIKAVLTKK